MFDGRAEGSTASFFPQALGEQVVQGESLQNHFLNTSCSPGTLLGTFYPLTAWRDLSLIDGETEAQRGQGTYSKTHSQ